MRGGATGGARQTGNIQSPALGFLHELAHFVNYVEDPVAYSDRKKGGDDMSDPYHNPEEELVITKVETPAAIILKEPIRTNHNGKAVKVSGPTYKLNLQISQKSKVNQKKDK